MSGLHGPTTSTCLIVVLTLGAISGAIAQPVGPLRGRRAVDVEATATLRMLSVRPLRVDPPWDPRICVGCEAHHPLPTGRAPTSPLR